MCKNVLFMFLVCQSMPERAEGYPDEIDFVVGLLDASLKDPHAVGEE